MKTNKGITLIALVVTIIVLIILAGVSISLIMGQDGIVKRATEGRDKYSNAAAYENEQLANVDAYAANIGSTTGGGTTPTEPGTSKIKFSNGTEAGIGLAESLKNYYGTEVHSSFFSSIENNVNSGEDPWTWQLFYDDANYIFLIASDYVPNSKLPAYGNDGYGSKDLVKKENHNILYEVAFCNNSSCNDYVLSPDSTYITGSASSALTNNPLTTIYLRWVTNNSTSTNKNIQATAFMMDTTKWSQFAGNKYANSFAIGGPTIELFVKSWNAASQHTDKQIQNYTMSSGVDYNEKGYKVAAVGSNSWIDSGAVIDSGNATNMWFIKETGKSSCYWLASPSSVYETCVGCVDTSGIGGNYGGPQAGSGIRPIVCIPKDSI